MGEVNQECPPACEQGWLKRPLPHKAGLMWTCTPCSTCNADSEEVGWKVEGAGDNEQFVAPLAASEGHQLDGADWIGPDDPRWIPALEWGIPCHWCFGFNRHTGCEMCGNLGRQCANDCEAAPRREGSRYVCTVCEGGDLGKGQA